MLTLKKLLNFLKNCANNRILGELNQDFVVDEILFLKDSIELSSNALYLTTDIEKSASINAKNILAIVPKADEIRSVLQLETNYCIDEIYKLICEFMLTEYKLYAKKCKIYNSLHNDNDIRKLLNTSETYLNNPIFILDTSYRIIGRSNTADSIHYDIQNHNGESYLIADIVNTMKRDKCIDNIYNSSTAFFHCSDQDLIFCGIRINNITIGYICVLREFRKFIEEDLDIVNTLSQALSFQMQRDNFFINNSGLEEEYYLMDLLMNRTDDPYYMQQRLESINFKLNKNLAIIAMPFSKVTQDYRHNFALRQLINNAKNVLGNCVSAYYEDKIIFLLSKDDCELFTKDTISQFEDFLKLNNLKAGVSLTFQNLLESKKFYRQSIHALNLAIQLKDEGYIFYFKDYLEYYLFYICENTTEDNFKKVALSALIHPLISQLINVDKSSNTELLKTLITYLECNRSANDASKKLAIHRSTFFYRFHRMEELLNISLNDSDLLFKLELSLKILRYQNLL